MHVDEAVVVRGAVDDDVVSAPAVVGIGGLAPVDHDPVVDRDLRRPGLAEDVLPLVDVAGPGRSEASDLVAEVVWAAEGEDISVDEPGRRPGVDAEERGAVGERRAAGSLIEARHGKAEHRAESAGQRKRQRDRQPCLGGRPEEPPPPRRNASAVLRGASPLLDRSLDTGIDPSRGRPRRRLESRRPLALEPLGQRLAPGKLNHLGLRLGRCGLQGRCRSDPRCRWRALPGQARSSKLVSRAPMAGRWGQNAGRPAPNHATARPSAVRPTAVLPAPCASPLCGRAGRRSARAPDRRGPRRAQARARGRAAPASGGWSRARDRSCRHVHRHPHQGAVADRRLHRPLPAPYRAGTNDFRGVRGPLRASACDFRGESGSGRGLSPGSRRRRSTRRRRR